jgi:hypothetical protein
MASRRQPRLAASMLAMSIWTPTNPIDCTESRLWRVTPFGFWG